jgi:hypothetical protein
MTGGMDEGRPQTNVNYRPQTTDSGQVHARQDSLASDPSGHRMQAGN